MKKALLGIRLLLEAMLGLICVYALPQQFMSVVLGYLGMPRRYHPRDLEHFYTAIMFGEVLWVMIIFLIGALCFKDVMRISRNLRAS